MPITISAIEVEPAPTSPWLAPSLGPKVFLGFLALGLLAYALDRKGIDYNFSTRRWQRRR